MRTQFAIQSSDPTQLEDATRVAEEFAQQYMNDNIVGIVFLGAIARGYFDPYADIDIVLFKAQESKISLSTNYLEIQGFEIHCGLADYTTEVEMPWDMAKRWAFSQGRLYYDPQGWISQLIREKVPLKPEERRWLLIEGMTQSEWYINTLSRVWIARGNVISAQHMFAQGLTHFFDALFALNDQLVADVKWRYFCAERLALLPPMFHERIQKVLLLNAFSAEDVERRKQAFMEMWRHLLPLVEQEVQMPFDEFRKLV